MMVVEVRSLVGKSWGNRPAMTGMSEEADEAARESIVILKGSEQGQGKMDF